MKYFNCDILILKNNLIIRQLFENKTNCTNRFNQRLILSLASNTNCIVADEEFTILNNFDYIRNIEPSFTNYMDTSTDSIKELKELRESLAETQPAGPLIANCKTVDQAKTVLSLLNAAIAKETRTTVVLTAARSRGKSATLGLAVAGALFLGYSNIFVCAPTPDNLRTFFDFVIKGLESLSYREHLDYSLLKRTDPEHNGNFILQINIFKNHRQIVHYFQPQNYTKLTQVELLVIDEAAAIPISVIKRMLGSFLVFLCSTINGYEGTGRSLSLKLIQKLREQQIVQKYSSGNVLQEVKMFEPIRYSAGDKVERWLLSLLCLDAADHTPSLSCHLPHPKECELYIINRNNLFSYHKASESFLQTFMSIYVASHIKHTPDDLLLISDSPMHQLFVLIGPDSQTTSNIMPDVIGVAQISLEGATSIEESKKSISDGILPKGNFMPRILTCQFQDSIFTQLSLARVVRIAVHPELSRLGYGTRVVELLKKYYSGNSKKNLENEYSNSIDKKETTNSKDNSSLLLSTLSENSKIYVNYIGVSFCLKQDLFNLWQRNGYKPIYMCQSQTDFTGEHVIILIYDLEDSILIGANSWSKQFEFDFKIRFIVLLAGAFRLLLNQISI
jgi:N-acetyltransferase 10